MGLPQRSWPYASRHGLHRIPAGLLAVLAHGGCSPHGLRPTCNGWGSARLQTRCTTWKVVHRAEAPLLRFMAPSTLEHGGVHLSTAVPPRRIGALLLPGIATRPGSLRSVLVVLQLPEGNRSTSTVCSAIRTTRRSPSGNALGVPSPFKGCPHLGAAGVTACDFPSWPCSSKSAFRGILESLTFRGLP